MFRVATKETMQQTDKNIQAKTRQHLKQRGSFHCSNVFFPNPPLLHFTW